MLLHVSINLFPLFNSKLQIFYFHFLGLDDVSTQPEIKKKMNVCNIFIIDDIDTKVQHKENSIIITANKIRDILLHSRKLSIMRDFLANYTDDLIRENLLNRIEKEAIKLQKELNLPNIPLFLPIDTYIKIFENNFLYQLNRSQILNLISSADCYDVNGGNLDYLLFVDYACETIPKMKSDSGFQNRINAFRIFETLPVITISS